jgi:hypothetical protein
VRRSWVGSGITSSSYITYDGKMNINASGQDFYIQISNTADTSSQNFRYRLVVTVDSYTSGSMAMAGGSAGFNSFTITDSFNDIIHPDSNGGSFQFRVINYVGVISSISLKKIEMGNHATTNFFGDELIENGGFESDFANWANIGTPTTSEVNSTGTYVNSGSKSWRIETDANQEGIYQNLGSDEYEAGKTYIAEAYVYLVDSITVELFINAQQIATTSTTGSFVKLSGTFVGSGSNRTLTVRFHWLSTMRKCCLMEQILI